MLLVWCTKTGSVLRVQPCHQRVYNEWTLGVWTLGVVRPWALDMDQGRAPVRVGLPPLWACLWEGGGIAGRY